MDLLAILLSFILFYHHFSHDRVQCSVNVLKKEGFDKERQRKSLDKPIVTTIVDINGDIYDCVNFYKQLAFNHPLLKNHTFDFQMNLFKLYNKTSADPSLVKTFSDKESNIAICPVGSIPVRKITEGNFIKERHILEDRQRSSINGPGTYLAIARKKAGKDEYAGAGCFMSVHNTRVHGNQFVATRIKLQKGSDSIEAGWRVDPSLYGDNKTRFYVRTDVGGFHCFNTRCPGFIHYNRGFPLDYVFPRISHTGGPIVQVPYEIVRNNENGNWDLKFGNYYILIGFWPASIFTGMARAADYIEWGGAAHSPLGSPLPPMGTGNFPIVSSDYDAFVGNMTFILNEGEPIVAKSIEPFETDSYLYSVYMLKSFVSGWGRSFFYGGPGSRKRE